MKATKQEIQHFEGFTPIKQIESTPSRTLVIIGTYVINTLCFVFGFVLVRVMFYA